QSDAMDAISRQRSGQKNTVMFRRKSSRRNGQGCPVGRFRSVRGRLRFQLFNLVLECQLASLEIDDLKIVDRGMSHRFVDFTLDIAVFSMQLVKMVSKR